jgi:hypothetical protein
MSMARSVLQVHPAGGSAYGMPDVWFAHTVLARAGLPILIPVCPLEPAHGVNH